jgi:hypothetical protein
MVVEVKFYISDLNLNLIVVMNVALFWPFILPYRHTVHMSGYGLKTRTQEIC